MTISNKYFITNLFLASWIVTNAHTKREVVPMDKHFSAWVYIKSILGIIVLHDDHTPALPTITFTWLGKEMTWHFDAVELWRQPTPPESKTPIYVLVDFALGPGWPTDKTPNPSGMLVDYCPCIYKGDTESFCAAIS